MKTGASSQFPLLLAALAAMAGAETPPQAPWLEIKAPQSRVVIITDGGEKAGRKAAFQVAQFDRAIARRFPWLKLNDDAPLTVFVTASEAMVRSMAPEGADAEPDSGLSSYLVASSQAIGAVRIDVPEPADKEPAPYRGFYRGRVASAIERSLGKSAPGWLSRGLVTFLGDSVVKDKEILVGRMSGVGTAPLSAPSPAEFFRDARGTDRNFDQVAGLFIHFLLVGDGGKSASGLDALLQGIAGRDQGAVQAAQAKVSGAYAGFSKYLGSKRFAPLKLSVDPSVSSATFATRVLPPAEALMLRAEALFELNRPVDVRGILRQVKQADPQLARPLEIEAALFEREQRTSEAKQAIEAAIQLGSRNAALYYRLAQLKWSRVMPKPALLEAQKLLETARDLLPGDAGTLAYLAEVQGDLLLTPTALENAQAASKASPGDVYAQMALARAQWNAKRPDEAISQAQKAAGLAKASSQKQRVQEFLTFAARNKRAQTAGTKPWLTQFGPPPSGSFGATRAVAGAVGNRVTVGQGRVESAEASAVAECFVNRNDAACARAVPVLEGACADKQATSCLSLGSLHDGGFGVARDRRRAAGFYKTACDLGEKAGCARFAVLEAQGLGVTKNAVRANKTLEALCAEKVPEGCIGLAQLLQQTGFATDRIRAASLLKAACDEGSSEACSLKTSR